MACGLWVPSTCLAGSETRRKCRPLISRTRSMTCGRQTYGSLRSIRTNLLPRYARPRLRTARLLRLELYVYCGSTTRGVCSKPMSFAPRRKAMRCPTPPQSGISFLAVAALFLEAMVRVWDTGSRDHAIAQTEWLLNNMYTDDRGFHGTAAPRTEAKDAYRASASLTSLIVGSIPLDGQESLREARRDYLQWLHQRVIRGRFAADVDLARAVVEQLKETITHSLENDDEEMGSITLHLMGRLWLDLPNDLRKLMEPDQEFLRTLGISMRSIVDIGPLRVDEQSFWDTLSRVLKDRVPEEFTTLEGHPVRIELVSDSPILFFLHCDDLQFDGRIGGPELGFLSESFAEREAHCCERKALVRLAEESTR